MDFSWFHILWPTRNEKSDWQHISFFLPKAKSKTEFETHVPLVFFQKHSFFWKKQKRNLEWWIPFSFFWRKHKGNCKTCNLYFFFPFPKETQKEIQSDKFPFLTKTIQEIGFASTLQVASFPGSPSRQTGPGRVPSRSIQLHSISDLWPQDLPMYAYID